MLNSSAKSSKQRLKPTLFQQFLKNWPVAFWGGLWASITLVSLLALLGLFTVEKELPESSKLTQTAKAIPGSEIPQGFTSVKKVPEQYEELPVWLFGSIAASCATGSLLIIIQLNRLKRAKPIKRPKSSSQVRPKQPPANYQPSPTITAKQPPPNYQSSPPLNTPPAPAVAPKPNSKAKKKKSPSAKKLSTTPAKAKSPPKQKKAKGVVTVLPPERKKPKDLDENTLVEMMDLRKKQSLSSLLRDR